MKARTALILITAIALIATAFGFVTDYNVIGAGDSRPTGIVTPGYTGLAPAPTAAPYPMIEPYPMGD